MENSHVSDETARPTPGPPLNPTEFQILLALADAERHGYGIMQEVSTRSGGLVRLGPGTLYGAIKRMLASGLIEESDQRPLVADDRRRRCYYRLTRSGRSAAADETRRLAELVRVAQAKRLVDQSILLPERGGA